MRKFVLILTLASLFVLTCAGVAFAYTNHLSYVNGTVGSGNSATSDRTGTITSSNCFDCHADSVGHTGGPHGGYASTTDKCQACHDVHSDEKRVNENAALLMGYTLTAACQYCHDLTTSWSGPYNMYGVSGVGSAHRVVGIDVYSYIDTQGHNNEPLGVGLYGAGVIPGADPTNGSSGGYNGIFNLTTGKNAILSDIYFTCNSCHTPHGVKTVDKYLGESPVKYASFGTEGERLYLTNRILRQRPNQTLANQRGQGTVPAAVYEYGSKWCLGCHAGRDDNNTELFETTHNHPVDTDAPGYRLVEMAKFNLDANNSTEYGGPRVQGDLSAAIAGSTDPLDAQNDFYALIKSNGFDGGRSYVTFGLAGSDFDKDPRTNQQFALTPGSFVDNNANREDDFHPLDVKYNGVDVYVDKGPACQQCHGSARDVEKKWDFDQDNFLAGNIANGTGFRTSFPHVSENKAFLTEKNGDDFCTNCHDPNILP